MLFVVYWLPEANLSFSVVESNGWTTPSPDASRGTYTTPEGVVEYPYISRYMGTVTALAGRTELPSYSFVAQGIRRPEDWPFIPIRYRYQYSVTINGEVQSRSPIQAFYRI